MGGLGAMVSLLISREFHFNFNSTKIQFDKVLEAANNKRDRTKYLNSKAAIAVHGSNDKKLTSTPFYQDFNYDKNRQGYWDGNHASAQLEDYIDFSVLYFAKINTY